MLCIPLDSTLGGGGGGIKLQSEYLPIKPWYIYIYTRYTQAHYASRSFMGVCMTKGYSSLQKYTEARCMI